jgi:hypothetical protein
MLVVALFCVFGTLFVATPALAQTSDAFATFGDATTLSQDNIAVIVARIIRIALSILGILVVVLIVYAGFLYMTARGEQGPIDKAKKIFQQGGIGLIIIFSAYGITTFILNALTDAAFGGSTTSMSESYSEPLSGSLGAGILDDHYPTRDARDIPRNTRIFVTFKEAIDPETMIDGYADDSTSTDLNTDSVLIYATEDGTSAALEPAEVEVTFDEAQEIWVFDPVDYLGSADSDTNYTVYLTNEILKADGEAAFTGSNADGYAWTFEVSTEVDLTPPTVVSVVPLNTSPLQEEPRNVTIEINFSEAMNPVAATGSYGGDEFFTNIEVIDSEGNNVEGTFEISNNYRTIDFTTTDACGEDPCGDTIYCLPGEDEITVTAKAASVDDEEPPQAIVVGVDYDGLVDAASNSLDGDGDDNACGSETDDVECDDGDSNDNYEWQFTTTDEVEDTVPHVVTLDPGIAEDEAGTDSEVVVTFNTQLKSSTVMTDNASLWPDPFYEFWFGVRKYNNEDEVSEIHIDHPTLVSTEDGGWDYWPVLTNGLKSSYQICMYPAMDEGSCTEGRSSSTPYCCNGTPSADECQTTTQAIAEDAGDVSADDFVLPDNSETLDY